MTIPTLTEFLLDTERRMAAQASGEQIPDDMMTEVERALDHDPINVDDLLMFIVLGHGCHTVAYQRDARRPGHGHMLPLLRANPVGEGRKRSWRLHGGRAQPSSCAEALR